MTHSNYDHLILFWNFKLDTVSRKHLHGDNLRKEGQGVWVGWNSHKLKEVLDGLGMEWHLLDTEQTILQGRFASSPLIQGTIRQTDFTNYLNPVMLVFIWKDLLRAFSWVPMCQPFFNFFCSTILFCPNQPPAEKKVKTVTSVQGGFNPFMLVVSKTYMLCLRYFL